MRRLIVVVAAALLLLTLPAAGVAAKQPTLPNYKPMTQLPSKLVGPTQPKSALKSSTTAKSADGGAPDYAPVTGAQVTGLLYDDINGYFLTNYTIAAVGQHIEVWVQNNMAWPAGDPRATPVVTAAQVSYLVNQFDNNIYPKESEFWRTPFTRVGQNNQVLPPGFWAPTDGKDRVIAMISNIRDANYYDPTFPVYIAGFFSPTIRDFMDRNVISIDSYDWANRVGPEGSPWRPNDGTANDVANLYEGTFAHEYQHLLHADQNPGEEDWVNEGLSDWTEWLVGYGIPAGHWDTAQQYAENSLVVWGDQGQGTEILADYGEAFMFMHYLYNTYGEHAMQALFRNPAFGIAGFNAALASLGIHDTFANMYHNFAIARLVLANKAPYQLKDIPSPVVLNSEAYSTPGAPPWGSDYLNLANPKKISSIKFDGVDMITHATAWTSVADPLAAGNQALYSGQGDEQDRWAIFANPGGSTLSFDTLYDNEEQWDFGFVMASGDNGATWHALTNADTRNDLVPDGYPKIRDVINDGGEGFTGYSGGWVHETFTLPAGTNLIGFRMMTDWGTNGNGVLDDPNWYVDNVKVGSTTVSDGSNASSFKDITFYNPTLVNFNVDLVSMPNLKPGGNSSKVLHLVTDDATEQATAADIKQALRASNYLVMIVTYDAPQGVSDYADYTFSVTY